jgi:hypothetical protein
MPTAISLSSLIPAGLRSSSAKPSRTSLSSLHPLERSRRHAPPAHRLHGGCIVGMFDVWQTFRPQDVQFGCA